MQGILIFSKIPETIAEEKLQQSQTFSSIKRPDELVWNDAADGFYPCIFDEFDQLDFVFSALILPVDLYLSSG